MKTQRSFEIPMQWRLPLVVGCIAVVFGLDLLTPRGIVDGALYVLPLWYARRIAWRHAIFVVAAVVTGLEILGYFVSPDGVDIFTSLTNRGLVILVIWATTVALYLNNANLTKLSQANVMLDQRSGELNAAKGLLEDQLRTVQKAERELQASEHQYRELFESSSDALLLFATDTGQVIDANEMASALYGYERDEFLTKTSADLSAEPEKTSRSIREAQLNPGQVINVPLRLHRKKDGTVFPVEVTARLIVRDKQSVIFTAIRDITERLRAEKRLQLLSRAIEQSVNVVLITDAEGHIQYANPQFTKITGYTLEEVIGRKPSILKSGETQPEVYAKLWNTILSGQEFHGIFHNKKKNGDLYWESLTISPVLNPEGVITHFVGIQEDISERRLLGDQIHQSQKMEAVGQLAGGIAHDFNNLLTVVLGNQQLLEGMLKDQPEASELLQDASKAAWRGAELCKRVLAFSRRQKLSPESIAVNELVEGMEKLLRRTLGQKVEVRLELGSDLAAIVVDPGQLENAILNLALNAHDAMPEGGTLSISTTDFATDEHYLARHPEMPAGQYVVIEVSDTGQGMTPDIVARVFEPFFTTKEIGKGSGLGLSMVYGFLKQSGGHARIYSEPGVGTSVKLYFPAAPSHTETRRLQLPVQLDEARGGSERILVVEDDAEVRATMIAMLLNLGYAVWEADSGAAGLEVLHREGKNVDLLLSDVVMPGGMDGDELSKQARALFPDLKVVLISGFSRSHTRYGQVPVAGAMFLNKPFRKDELARMLRQVLDA